MKKLFMFLIVPMLVSFNLPFTDGERPEVVSIKATDTAMVFTITTQTYGGTYSPKHCLAIWVTDANNNFKKTLKLAAQTYKMHLVKWNQMSGGNVTDAITGPSLTSHTTHTVIWNGKDKNGVVQPDGNYKVYIEFTEENSLQSSIPDGPWTAFSFTKGTAQVQNPPDVTYTFNGQNKTVFKNIQITTFGNVYVENTDFISNIKIFPNPTFNEAQIRINLNSPQWLDVKIINVDGKCVHQFPKQIYNSGEHIFFWYANTENVHSGIYFVNITDGKETKSIKLIVK
ncbi:MAG: DUF2271 domain-containing protein [Bacteroidales bacterium]|nr:DUF2271 domain-containing protein [Bacteroidales bacterium]